MANINTNFSFKQLSHEQGLPGINLRDQFQDSRGTMWFCIEAIGLCKYDGHKFTLYEHNVEDSTSISSNFTNSVVEDQEGNLWVATDYGLNKFNVNEQSFEHFFFDKNDPFSIPSNVCKSLFLRPNGDLWIGTENGLAVKQKEASKFQRYLTTETQNGLISHNAVSINKIIGQDEDFLWLATESGLYKFFIPTGQFRYWVKSENTSNSPKSNRQLDIIKGRGTIFWIATDNGIDRFDYANETFSPWHYNSKDQNELFNEGINTFHIDKNDKLWVGTFTKGIVIIDLHTLEYTRIDKDSPFENTIKSNHIRDIFEDNMGLIWIGTKFQGIFKYNDMTNVFKVWPEKYQALAPYKNLYLLSFYADNDYAWLGTKVNGLIKVHLKTGTVKQYLASDKRDSIESNRIQYIFRSKKGELWLGTDVGLYMLNEQAERFSKYNDEVVNYLCNDQFGNLWIGTKNGLYHYNCETKEFGTFNPGYSNNFFGNSNLDIMQILADSSGTIWFSTRYNGLFSYSIASNQIKHFLHDENMPYSISGNMSRAIFEDSNKNIWIGTKSNGLNLYDRKKEQFYCFNREDGLPSDMILNIEEDWSGNLWLGTQNGISKFNFADTTFSNYNSDYGLLSNIAEYAASFTFDDGTLLFGGNNGFNIFSPETLRENDFIAPLIFTSIKVKDEEIKSDLSDIDGIQLNYNENFVSFEFTLTDYNNPYRHQYAVYLEGVDADWKLLGNRNYISYTNLEPGTYNFYVKAANEFGRWSSTALSLPISIQPAFYMTLGFKIFLIITFIGFVLFLIFNSKIQKERLETQIKERTQKLEFAYKELLSKNTKIREQNRQIEAHHVELEKKVTERTKDLEKAKIKAEESDKLKSSFLANISHEIRTPLNAITGFTTLLTGDIDGIEKAKKEHYVSIIKNNSNSLMKLVEDILDISSLEANQVKLDKSFFNFHETIHEIFTSCKEDLKKQANKPVRLTLSARTDGEKKLFFKTDQTRLRQVVINLLNNAIKFTSIGKIEIGYEVFKDRIKLWVKDTGIGIKEEDIDSIFDRFTKIEQNNTLYGGTGLGLCITKNLTELMNGRIYVESTLGIGSKFTIEIPGEVKFEGRKRNNEWYGKLDLSGQSILIVEDEKSNFELLNSFLSGTDAQIMWAQHGEIALKMIESQTFKIVFLDIRMPVMNGYETIEAIRKKYPDLIVIAQTAYATAEEEKKIFKAGFSDLLIKPYTREELYAKIDNVLSLNR